MIMPRKDEIERLDVEALPEDEKKKLIRFLVDAILDKRIRFTIEHDEKMNGFFKKVCNMPRRGVSQLTVKPIVLVMAIAAYNAITIHGHKYFRVTDITETGVYGLGFDK